MRISQHLLIGLFIAILWVMLTNVVSIDSFLIGYVVGITLSWLLAQGQVLPPLGGKNIPGRILAIFIYLLQLSRDIFLSGVDVMLRVMGVRPTRPGIIAVPVQHPAQEDDELVREVIAGLSAASITITPGELVVDYSDDGEIMYVHVLDIETAGPTLDPEQTERMKVFRKVLGRD